MKDLAKLIPRLGTFNPIDREQEVLQWREVPFRRSWRSLRLTLE